MSPIVTIERKSAWYCALGTMHIVINDIIRIDLKNGQEQKVEIPASGDDCNIQVLNNIFHIKNIQNVSKIVLKFESNLGPGAARVSCLVIYSDGNKLNASNKSFNIDTNHTIYIVILLIFLFLFLERPLF